MISGKESREKESKPRCPYCEQEILAAGFAYCQPCGVKLRHCARCETVVVREVEVCPQCGGELEWK